MFVLSAGKEHGAVFMTKEFDRVSEDVGRLCGV